MTGYNFIGNGWHIKNICYTFVYVTMNYEIIFNAAKNSTVCSFNKLYFVLVTNYSLLHDNLQFVHVANYSSPM